MAHKNDGTRKFKHSTPVERCLGFAKKTLLKLEASLRFITANSDCSQLECNPIKRSHQLCLECLIERTRPSNAELKAHRMVFGKLEQIPEVAV